MARSGPSHPPRLRRVGETEIARQFFVGKYAEILASTFDRGVRIADVDVGFVVGALTFVDRTDDAAAVFDAWRERATRSPDPRTVAAGSFFLGLAYARAGYFDRSFSLLVTAGFRARHDPDPWIRALAYQSIACQCYFTGRFVGAARNAARAVHAAHAAEFAYAAMLGTDMRGHSLIQIGQLQRGIALLEQAAALAKRLGLTNNEFAVATSIATYVTRFVPHVEALEQVESLLRGRAHDSYSRRSLLVEAAVQRALRGRRTQAIEALDAAGRDALRGDSRRGRAISLLAKLWVTRCQHGAVACRDLVAQGHELIAAGDVGFRGELLGFDILVARASLDSDREQRALHQLHGLRRLSHHYAATASLGQFDPSVKTTALDEDEITPLLRAVASRDQAALPRIVAVGLLGLIPELLGLTPGRRIIRIPSEDLLVLEDHGDIVVRQRPPRWAPLLLQILASGDASKERIVAGLWGLRTYHPELHDPPVRTAIHRLRTFLRPYDQWIVVAEDGYRTTVPIHTLSGAEPVSAPAAALWEEGEVPVLESHRAVAVDLEGTVDDTPTHLVYQRLTDLEHATVPQLARSLELSNSTVLRALRSLVEDRRVERLGHARATRYRAMISSQ